LVILEENYLIECEVWPMPGQEQDGRVRAIATESTAAPPVGVAAHAVPGLVWHAMDPGDLVIRRPDVFILSLEVFETQNEEVVMIWKVEFKVQYLPAEGYSSYRIKPSENGRVYQQQQRR
jgi:hypothetical protein